MAEHAPRTNTPTAQAWRRHAGFGRPVPIGTLVDVRRFNGEVERFFAGCGPTVDPAGNQVAHSRARWSTWDHFDGGPMAVKCREYRVVQLVDVESILSAEAL